MSDSFVNVHLFDGRLKNQFTPIHDFSTTSKRTLFENLKLRVTDARCKSMLDQIISDLETGKNFDEKNEIDSSDILGEICLKVGENTSIDIAFIEEQLIDMAVLGRCAQGRTTRFLQIWKALNV